MKTHSRIVSLVLTGVITASMWLAPNLAQASEAGRKNTALLLGAASAYLLLTQHNKLPGIITAAGTLVAYNRYEQAVRNRHRWDYGNWNRNLRGGRVYAYNGQQDHWVGRRDWHRNWHKDWHRDWRKYRRDGRGGNGRGGHWDRGRRDGRGGRYHWKGRGDRH